MPIETGAVTRIADIARFGAASCTPSVVTVIQRMIAVIQSPLSWIIKGLTRLQSAEFSDTLAETSQSASTPTKGFGSLGVVLNS